MNLSSEDNRSALWESLLEAIEEIHTLRRALFLPDGVRHSLNCEFHCEM